MSKLRLAVQKSGRLSEQSLSLIRECGINFSNSSKKLLASSGNFDLEILYLRDDDIPGYVEDGVADIGIVGKNVLEEKGAHVETLRNLGFSRCRLSLAIPKSEDYSGLEYFNGRSIATSYPRILQGYLDKKGIRANIHEISGSVEIAPGIGLADGICDIVSTGSTLLSNGLKEVEQVFRSEAILIGKSALDESKKAILQELLFRIDAVMKARAYKYILLNAPNDKLQEIIEILPGVKSPTVNKLAMEGWSSVSTVIEESAFWEVIGLLRQKGAQGILVMAIEKIIV